VLGFTTGAWHGGQGAEGVAARRPAGTAGAAQRAAARRLQGLRDDLAARPRRHRRPAARRALPRRPRRRGARLGGDAPARAARRGDGFSFVVSDGSPTDGADRARQRARLSRTPPARGAGAIERGGAIELHALGVGLDLGAWYASSHLLDLDARIGNAMFAEVLALLAAQAPAEVTPPALRRGPNS
jgi:cobaltochelatase CobT